MTCLPGIPTILGTIKTEHLDTEKAFGSDIAGPSGANLETPVSEHGTPPKKRKAKPKVEPGSLSKKQKANLGTPTISVRNVTPSPDNFSNLPDGRVECLI